jgi:exodeoxyribonuclease V alpha subunit
MTTIFEFLNQLRGHGLLADIDVAFSRFIGENADSDPSLTLLAALVSNAASMHGEIALPADKINTRGKLRYYLENLSTGDNDDTVQDSGEMPDFSFVDRLKNWPPDPNAFPCLFREYSPDSGEAFQPAPLLLVNGLYYLGRAFQNELFLRDYLRLRTNDASSAESIPFETVTKLELGEEQKTAAAAAVNSKFLVISGGPGTGKTTIVSIILALRGEKPSDIILCAPTGKAQMRMKQALDQQLENLRDDSRRAEIAQIQSSTIHRLLSWNPQDGTFRHNRKNPLRYKLFIVDECSMIAQSLMVSLLKAVPDDASVILLGDRYQLSSVEPGSVFGDFCSILRGSEPDRLVELTESRRFPQGGEICIMKDAINAGQAEEAWEYMTQSNRKAVVSRDIPPKHALRQFLMDEIEAADAWFYRKGSVAVRYCDEDTVDAAWERFEQFRILTPFNVGPYGANALNRLARSILGFPDTGGPVPGETFLVLRNDYGTNVFNGDTGILWFAGDDGRPLGRSEAGSRANRLLVFFPDPASEFKWRGIPPESLPQYAPAYAFTIHKSQGSDYDNILLFLPPSGTDHGIVTRESVYTGLTRAKKKAVIVAGHDAFRGAVERHIDRVSGLPRLCMQDK